MKTLIIFIVLNVFLLADDSKKVSFTNSLNAPFIIIQENPKTKQITITSEEQFVVKSDGSYCYLDEKTKELVNTQYDSEYIFPEKYCKNKPDLKNVTKVIATVKNKTRAYPLGGETKTLKAFDIKDEDFEKYSDDYYLTNESIDSSHTIKMGKNIVKLEVTGKPTSSRGLCSGESSPIISLKIDNNKIFDNLQTINYCSEFYVLHNITLDFKNKEINLVTSYEDYDALTRYSIPFNYFQKKNNIIKYLNKETFDRLKVFKNL